MQRSHTRLGTDLVAVAKACGIEDALRIDARSGPVLAQVLITTVEPRCALPPRDGVFVKNRFRAVLGLAPF
jgi:hypothetical protein